MIHCGIRASDETEFTIVGRTLVHIKSNMSQVASNHETRRLVVRRFTTQDGEGIQELAKDKESSDGAIYNHAWPTSEKGCRAMAKWCAGQTECFAVCLKTDGRLIGFIRFNGVDEQLRLDLGHMFHTRYRHDGYATEAIHYLVDVAFDKPEVQSIVARNAVDWPGQLTPLNDLGFLETGRGKGSFTSNSQGRSIGFMACTMELKRDDWSLRGRMSERRRSG